ncbi:MAG: hypothetical protein J2P17_11945 [Mycobacterium sp.]|nr:hypothetical protein [Mycobacterium sp.]
MTVTTQRRGPAGCGSTVEIADISPYSTLIIGSAIHNGKWLQPEVNFIEPNPVSLRERAVSLFSVSSLGDHSGAFSEPINRWLRRMRKAPSQIAGFRTATATSPVRSGFGRAAPSSGSLEGISAITATGPILTDGLTRSSRISATTTWDLSP